jgi:hypothetical protein
MKESIPHDVLSDYLQDLIADRQLVAAVFITFQFDPGFFELEVLPVLIDVPLSHSEKVRLVQLKMRCVRMLGESRFIMMRTDSLLEVLVRQN